uniref:Uncharacterized protein n=1 Tax=Ixodes ricinus TaxID=34613 RepID=A0A6B0UCT7_IXORI
MRFQRCTLSLLSGWGSRSGSRLTRVVVRVGLRSWTLLPADEYPLVWVVVDSSSLLTRRFSCARFSTCIARARSALCPS